MGDDYATSYTTDYTWQEYGNSINVTADAHTHATLNVSVMKAAYAKAEAILREKVKPEMSYEERIIKEVQDEMRLEGV